VGVKTFSVLFRAASKISKNWCPTGNFLSIAHPEAPPDSLRPHTDFSFDHFTTIIERIQHGL
jgi:hypothetical protein